MDRFGDLGFWKVGDLGVRARVLGELRVKFVGFGVLRLRVGRFAVPGWQLRLARNEE